MDFIGYRCRLASDPRFQRSFHLPSIFLNSETPLECDGVENREVFDHRQCPTQQTMSIEINQATTGRRRQASPYLTEWTFPRDPWPSLPAPCGFAAISCWLRLARSPARRRQPGTRRRCTAKQFAGNGGTGQTVPTIGTISSSSAIDATPRCARLSVRRSSSDRTAWPARSAHTRRRIPSRRTGRHR